MSHLETPMSTSLIWLPSLLTQRFYLPGSVCFAFTRWPSQLLPALAITLTHLMWEVLFQATPHFQGPPGPPSHSCCQTGHLHLDGSQADRPSPGQTRPPLGRTTQWQLITCVCVCVLNIEEQRWDDTQLPRTTAPAGVVRWLVVLSDVMTINLQGPWRGRSQDPQSNEDGR